MKIYYSNINKKKLCNRNNGELKTLPRFDFQMQDYFSVTFIDSLNKIIDIDPNDLFYIAGGLDVMKNSENLLFYSEDFTLENNRLTFTIDTYTDNYLNHIKNTNTPIYLEIGILNEKKTILLQDTVLAEPRVYLDGVAPTNIEIYYTKAQIDEKLAAVEIEQTDPIYTADKPNLALKSELPGPTDYVRSINGIAPQDQDMGHITLSAADIRTLTGNDVQSSINQLNNRITNIENSSSGGSESSSDITEIEVINGAGSALEVDAKSLEELKSTYLFGPLIDAAIIFPIFDSLPQTLDKACEKTIEIWLQNNMTITTIEFLTSTVINSDSIPTQLDPANHVFTVRISYTPDLGGGSANQYNKKIAVNYAYSFDII